MELNKITLHKKLVSGCAQNQLRNLPKGKLFGSSNPFDWMELISLQGKTNFFEKRVTPRGSPGTKKQERKRRGSSWTSKFGMTFFAIFFGGLPSLKLTWHLKMDGWSTSFLLGWPIFRGYVSFRECNCCWLYFYNTWGWHLVFIVGVLCVSYVVSLWWGMMADRLKKSNWFGSSLTSCECVHSGKKLTLIAGWEMDPDWRCIFLHKMGDFPLSC